MHRIGIDFDNTIACYDRAFVDVAVLMGLDVSATAATKVDIKNQLVQTPGGDVDWQRLQGQVYGRHMLRAEMFAGFAEFCRLARRRGHELFIVSHKSEFGHFDEERISLRDQSVRWMVANGFFLDEGLGFSREHVFFETTRAEKVRRIARLGCTHFIDDLSEVFDEPEFPTDVSATLFRPGASLEGRDRPSAVSWRALAEQLLGPWTEADVCAVAAARFPQLKVERAVLMPGRGNSRVFKLSSGAAESHYVLKVYPDRQLDPRPRLETEFAASQALRRQGYPVAEPVACDAALGWAVYRWIDGEAIGAPDAAFMADARAFVERLYRDSRRKDVFAELPAASEACLSGAEIERQIMRRVERLAGVASEPLQAFLQQELLPVFGDAVRDARRACGDAFSTDLPRDRQVASPSDFGAHNARRAADGHAVFFDFEYCGWDDPVKLVSDVYWHPGMCLDQAQRQQWIAWCLELFQDDLQFAQRLQSYLPLFGLRWCLIQLNEFARSGAAHRVHAAPQKAADLDAIRRDQLQKSRALLSEIEEVRHVPGRTFQTSASQHR